MNGSGQGNSSASGSESEEKVEVEVFSDKESANGAALAGLVANEEIDYNSAGDEDEDYG